MAAIVAVGYNRSVSHCCPSNGATWNFDAL